MPLVDWLSQFKPLWIAWFCLLFAAILVWTFWPSRRQRLEDYGRIPLADPSAAGDERHGQ